MSDSDWITATHAVVHKRNVKMIFSEYVPMTFKYKIFAQTDYGIIMLYDGVLESELAGMMKDLSFKIDLDN